MLQIAGGLLLFGCTCAFGWHAASVEERSVQQTEGLLLLLRHIRTRIVCFCDPLEKIYAEFRHAALEACGLLPALRREGLARALQACGDHLYIETEALRTLAAFADEVGKSRTHEQAALCDRTIGELEAALVRRREEAPRRAHAARALAVCGGLALLLLLI